MKKQGESVPDFRLPDQTGRERSLSQLLEQGSVVLFFYPAAMTAGCTKESCHFRDLSAQFAAVGAVAVGISVDPVAKQKEFDDKHRLGFPLLSDPGGEVAREFGVKGGPLGLTPVRRATFVIGPDRVVRKAITSELNMNAHADRALAELSAG